MKKLLSLILCLVMIFSMVPVSAFAEEGVSSEVSTDDVEFEGTSSVGNLIVNTIENSSLGNEGQYGSVLDVKITGTAAEVEFSTDRDSEIVVAIYEENGEKMLGSGHAFVSSEATTATVNIETEEMPQYFWTGVYLLDAESHEPLCDQYISRYYTQEFQEFLGTTAEDYDSDRVLNLDEQTDTNFLVFNDSTIILDPQESGNYIIQNGDGTYTVTEPDERILNLQPGDSIAKDTGDEILVIVAESVSVSDGVVTIVEKTDSDLSDVFDYVKIDAGMEDSEVEYNPGTLADGFTVTAEDYQANALDVDFSVKRSTSFDVDITEKISGSLKFEFGINLKLYLSLSWQYFEFKIPYSVEFEWALKIFEAELKFPLGMFGISILDGKFEATMNPEVVISSSVELQLVAKLEGNLGFAYDSDTGFYSLCSWPKYDCDLNISGKVFVGLQWVPRLTGGKWLDAEVGGRFGVEAKAKQHIADVDGDDYEETYPGENHDCLICFKGTLSAVMSVEAKFKLKFLGADIEKKKTLHSGSLKLADFFFSVTHGVFAFGTCPYIQYKTVFEVKDENDAPLKDAVINLTSGETGTYKTDAEGKAYIYLPNGSFKAEIYADSYKKTEKEFTVKDDSKYIPMKLLPLVPFCVSVVDSYGDPVPVATLTIAGAGNTYGAATDEEGKAYIPLQDGSYEITVIKDGLSKTVTVTVQNGGEITITLDEDSSATVASGTCGENLTWVLNDEGTLTVSGTGEMEDSPAWLDEYRRDIKKVIIRSGVTSIGNQAFYYCKNLLSIELPEGLTSIGQESFCDCSLSAGIELPSSVTQIGDSAFSGCLFESIILPDGVTTIKFNTFAGSDLTSVTLPAGLTAIEKDAFTMCEELQSINIPESVTSIGERAFAYCKELESVEMHNNVEIIGNNAFKECSKLSTVRLSNNLTKLGIGIFHSCYALSEIVIPDKVKSIDGETFRWCGLKTVTIPRSVTFIGSNSFYGNSGITDVYYSGTEEQWNSITIEDYNDDLTSATIHFSDGTTINSLSIEDDEETIEEENTVVPEEENTEEPVNEETPADGGIIEEPQDGAAFEEPVQEEVTEEEKQDNEENAETGEETEAFEAQGVAAYSPAESGSSVASFAGLVPGENYVFIAVSDPGTADLLAGSNLQYISEAKADGSGSISFSYVPRTESAAVVCMAYGASVNRLSEAEIRIEQLIDDSYRVTVSCGGEVLEEGTDYILDLEETEDTVIVTVTGRDRFSGTKTAEGEKIIFSDASVKLDQDYIILKQGGESAQLNAEVNPAEYSQAVRWKAIAADEGETAPFVVNSNGLVTALNGNYGTGYVIASVTNAGRTYMARCRVDVVENDSTETAIANAVTGVQLTETKATVELYRTDYTRISVIPLLEQNLSAFSVNSIITPGNAEENTGAAVSSAYFGDGYTYNEAHRFFKLRVVDDRTLEIIPTYEAMTLGAAGSKELKASYKTPVTVVIDGESFTTPVMTLTVKKTLPKISAKAVKLNSFIAGDTQSIGFSGAQVEWIKEDKDKENPDWIHPNEEDRSVTFTGATNLKKTGKLYLEAKLEGWAITRPLTVSVSAAATKPKLTFKPGTLTVKPGTGDRASAAITITPAQFADKDITVSKIFEGTNEVTGVLDARIENGVLTVMPGTLDSSIAHTYKVYLSITGVEYPVTVKTLSNRTAVTLTAKASGSIDTMIPKSPIVITATPKNYHAGSGERYDIIIRETPAGSKASAADPDVTDKFEVTPDENTISITQIEGSELNAKNIYTAYVSMSDGQINGVVAKGIKLSVKTSKTVTRSVTLKAKGSLDVLRPATEIILTPTVKNMYDYALSTDMLSFYKVSGKTYVEDSYHPFNVSLTEDGKGFIISLDEGQSVNYKTDKYSVGIDVDGVKTKTPLKLTIKQGAAKFMQSTKTITLLKNDIYSSEIVKIAPTDSALKIRKVQLDAKSDAMYDLTDLGNGTYAISYNENKVPAKAAAAKLQVFLEGNNTTTPNATVSISVKIK